MAGPSSHPEFLRAERQFTRSVLAGIVLLGLVAVAGPLLSYRSDVHEVRGQFRARIARESRVYAEALGLHLKLLKSELARVAAGVGPDLQEEKATEDMQDLTAPEAGLFRQGIVLVDAAGRPRWSEPHELLAGPALLERPWFQRVLAQQAPTVDALAPGSSTFVVAVPVVRKGRTVGMLAGLLDAGADLPGARPTSEHLTLLVLNRNGDLFLPSAPPAWSTAPGFASMVEEMLAQGGRELETGHGQVFAWATPVPGTELRLVLATDETSTLAAIRSRLLAQLLVLAVLQVGTLLLFGLHWRRVYRLFLEMERRAAEKETMAALGSAAGLIAHEVKNSLNGLKVATGMLSQTEEQGLAVRTLRGQIDRLAHLATSLLHFGKPARVQCLPMDLPHLVREVLEGLRVLPEAEEVRVEAHLPEELLLTGDPLLLATALDNLVRNAMEAAVAAKDLGKVDSPEVRVSVRQEGDKAVVEVEDNAGGPPPGFEDRLFEPFVTTKSKGVGLGLSMTRRAVEQQGGRLTFERIPGGSRFTLHLPAQPPRNVHDSQEQTA
ncbi:sensor histidine kinase [Vitiosangium sp. GDMCC 1.1324]|uniref:sensor histidine kinase n=1 Tax=Vitiosangium sp. (strain GDMCC 1.1324) TaxID=2138576 RepID=UPI000D366B57|nr:sensor histidine kinase [Vitiosangium sp. GDMCC 1.1324]PTL76453.1 sensor histidine kinase [Vitiosangium sp. GDMCC 1.1324]